MTRDKTDKTTFSNADYASTVLLAKKILQEALSINLPEWKTVGADAADILFKDKAFLMPEAASWYPEIFDLQKYGLAELLERGEEIPSEHKRWLIMYLRDELVRPNGKTGRNKNYRLAEAVCKAIEQLADQGMSRSRNDTSEPTSACDAVADALGQLELQPSTFHGVKRLWLSHRRLERRIKETAGQSNV